MMLSVVIATYNHCESLRDILRSLKDQVVDRELALELLVIDNNSTDRTKEVVAEALRGSPWPIRYIFEPKQGLNHARNRGIKEASGMLVAFTDDDTIADHSWCQGIADAFAKYDVDAVSGKILPLWQQSPPAWLVSTPLRTSLSGALAWLDQGPVSFVSDESNNLAIYGPNMAFRKSVFAEIGLFNTALGRNGRRQIRCGETELIIRLFDAGKKAAYMPGAVIYHKIPPERVSLAYFRRWKYHYGRSLALMSPQTYGARPWLVRECGMNALRALWAYARGHQTDGIQRELWFWLQLGQLVESLRPHWRSAQAG